FAISTNPSRYARAIDSATRRWYSVSGRAIASRHKGSSVGSKVCIAFGGMNSGSDIIANVGRISSPATAGGTKIAAAIRHGPQMRKADVGMRIEDNIERRRGFVLQSAVRIPHLQRACVEFIRVLIAVELVDEFAKGAAAGQ